MSDIAKRLRTVLDEASLGPGHWEPIEDAIAEIDRLREALKPFAKEAERWSPAANDGHFFPDSERVDHTELVVGDFRRAALAKEAGR